RGRPPPLRGGAGGPPSVWRGGGGGPPGGRGAPPPPPPPEEAEALVRHAHAGERRQRAALQAVQDRRLGGRSGDVS
ncbi:hypothetical protein, partial [Nocardia farcinica]|uniref:hypothetical protein n=1 Tax=Nocardia farcinica TaxID=37329 RepID=UPI00245375E6